MPRYWIAVRLLQVVTIPLALATVVRQQAYSDARTIRALYGHDAAVSLYQELLKANPDDVTAATHIASHPDSISRHQRLGDPTSYTIEECQHLSSLLREWKFTPVGIAEHIFLNNLQPKAILSSSPLYLQPMRAGQKAPPIPDSSLSTCIQIFLLSTCIPISICQQYLGSDLIDLCMRMGILFVEVDSEFVIPYCHITPVDCASKTLYFITDLHPNVLSTTTIDDRNQAVMYIGPDSIALVDHWTSLLKQSSFNSNNCKIVDICTGSGIQAIAVATRSLPPLSNVTCVDLNPRALRITNLNFALNGLPSPTLILGDIQDATAGGSTFDEHCYRSWKDIMEQSTMILANPPFLPVPMEDTISKRHGWFSNGGPTGEDILQRVIELSADCLTSSDGSLAIVSEFMNPHSTFVEKRLKKWWGARPGRSLLFVNEKAMDIETYSLNRADSQSEYETWLHHLQNKGITHVSPGLLFIRTSSSSSSSSEFKGLSHETVSIPKTENGSLWTPSNVYARKLSQQKVKELDLNE